MFRRRREAIQYDVRGSRLRCAVCGETRFFKRIALLGSGWLSFLNVEWFGRTATTFTCAECGHMLWFRPRR